MNMQGTGKQKTYVRVEGMFCEHCAETVSLVLKTLPGVGAVSLRRNVAEIFIEEYIRAFAPVKAGLTALRLDAASLAALRKLIDTCTAEFTASFRKRVIEGE